MWIVYDPEAIWEEVHLSRLADNDFMTQYPNGLTPLELLAAVHYYDGDPEQIMYTQKLLSEYNTFKQENSDLWRVIRDLLFTDFDALAQVDDTWLFGYFVKSSLSIDRQILALNAEYVDDTHDLMMHHPTYVGELTPYEVLRPIDLTVAYIIYHRAVPNNRIALKLTDAQYVLNTQGDFTNLNITNADQPMQIYLAMASEVADPYGEL